MPTLHRRTSAVIAIGLALVLAACSPGPTPSPSPTPNPGASSSPVEAVTPTPIPTGGDALAVYAAIARQVSEIRGLTPTADIEPVVIDEATLRTDFERRWAEQNPDAEVAASERLLGALGLLAPGVSLRDAYLDLNDSQVIGYYASDDDALFIVDRAGALGATARVTYAHEFTHQLQDQTFDLESLGDDADGESDRSLAMLALVEGDATLAQIRWLTANLGADDLAELIRDSTDPALTEALARAPRFLVATSLFGYQDGLAFVTALGAFEGVNAAYADPPASTEQVLHPEKYLAGEVASPPWATLPARFLGALPSGWAVGDEDTLGEFLLRFWLSESGVATDEAADAAAGWGGDRVVLFDGPAGGVTVLLATTWDGPGDADAFAVAARSAVRGLPSFSRVVDSPGGRVSVVLGSDPAVVEALAAEVAGR